MAVSWLGMGKVGSYLGEGMASGLVTPSFRFLQYRAQAP